MENPNTWTPLHHEIHILLELYRLLKPGGANLPARAIAEKLGYEDVDLGATEVARVIKQWETNVREGMCGLSLEATLVSELNQKGENQHYH